MIIIKLNVTAAIVEAVFLKTQTYRAVLHDFLLSRIATLGILIFTIVRAVRVRSLCCE